METFLDLLASKREVLFLAALVGEWFIVLCLALAVRLLHRRVRRLERNELHQIETVSALGDMVMGRAKQ